MALSKKPVTGMKDIMPAEMQLRDYVISIIKETYGKFGFTSIETPSVENIANLSSKQGGENEKLIFKILKRGEKFANSAETDLCDLGLRYDLTVPLSRFYANNVGNLPSVFKAMQMDSVWRADRPQRGRFRQFVQCDIDIIGESSSLAETELISATTKALNNLGFNAVTVRLSDRRLLNALADKCGFAESHKPSVFIALDKLDKIGIDGVKKELSAIESGKAKTFIDLIEQIQASDSPFDTCVLLLGEYLPEEVKQNIRDILYVANSAITNGKVVFDVTLVRGMGYYTGTIYEVSVDGLNSAIAGGGRYDKMIGKLTGQDVPACGFSIGFERIALLMEERGVSSQNKLGAAVLLDKKLGIQERIEVMRQCDELRKQCNVTVLNKIKNFGYQLKQLREQGYADVYEFRNGVLSKID